MSSRIRGRNVIPLLCVILMTIPIAGCEFDQTSDVRKYYIDLSEINGEFERSLEKLSGSTDRVKLEEIDSKFQEFEELDTRAIHNLRLLTDATAERMSDMNVPPALSEKHAIVTARWKSGFSASSNDYFCSGSTCICVGTSDCNDMFDSRDCDFTESWPDCADIDIAICSCLRPVCC